MNNLEKLKNMNVDEMTDFIFGMVETADCIVCPAYDKCVSGLGCKINIKNWLKSKVDKKVSEK